MRIFLAGASGVVGRRLVPRLVELGHDVSGMTRSATGAETVAALGAEPVHCNAFDAEGLGKAVIAARPEVVIHHLTDLPRELKPRNMKHAYAATDRVRREGTPNPVQAALAAGARRVVAQSVAFVYAPGGSTLKTELDPLYENAPAPFDRSVRATQTLERTVLGTAGIDGVVLRFGFFYGPGTTYSAYGYTTTEVMRRRFPIVGRGTGVFSFVHVDDVVSSTIAALDQGSPGTYNIVDDEPAPVAEWLPVLAEAVGAKPPRQVPRLIAQLVMGKFRVGMLTELQGASNENAKRGLAWEPSWPSWREGFRQALG